MKKKKHVRCQRQGESKKKVKAEHLIMTKRGKTYFNLIHLIYGNPKLILIMQEIGSFLIEKK